MLPRTDPDNSNVEDPIATGSHVAIRDFELDGRTVRKGQKLWAIVAAANRDADQFPERDRLDITTRPNRHVALGCRTHTCLRAPLARLQSQIAPCYEIMEEEDRMTQGMEAVSVESDVAQLFVDDALIAETKEVWRTLNHLAKHERNPVLEPDRPWEGYLVLQPGAVLYDEEEGIFRMWYNTQPSREKPDVRDYLCYAVSRDGVTWDKPELGLVEHQGSTANNILLPGVYWTHCVLKDDDENDARRRYELAYWSVPRAGHPAIEPGIQVAFSPDGIQWEPYEGNPVVPSGWATGDTFSVMRDPRSGQYWLYHKTPAQPIRTVSRMVSDDFVHWRQSRRVLAPDAFDPPDTQFYGLSAFPYAGQYLGFLWVYHTYPQIPHLRLLGWLLWSYSRCGVSTGVLIGLCAASLRGLATVSRQLWSLSG